MMERDEQISPGLCYLEGPGTQRDCGIPRTRHEHRCASVCQIISQCKTDSKVYVCFDRKATGPPVDSILATVARIKKDTPSLEFLFERQDG